MGYKFPLRALPIGVDDAVTCNYSASAGASENCDKGCYWYGNGCYAESSEKLKPNLKKSGQEREQHPTRITNEARLQMRTRRNIWFRFSSRGSVPKVSQAKRAAGFETAFKGLAKEIIDSGSLCHFPVESQSKRVFYQSLCDSVKEGAITVRESVHSLRSLWSKTCPRSFVVGKRGDGKGIAQRIEQAKGLRDELQASGVSAMVCPKVKPRNYNGKKGKCGQCTGCSDARVSVILYPLHR